MGVEVARNYVITISIPVPANGWKMALLCFISVAQLTRATLLVRAESSASYRKGLSVEGQLQTVEICTAMMPNQKEKLRNEYSRQNSTPGNTHCV